MAYKGFFRPQNPSKYMGDPTSIVYRSLWERRFMKYCDQNAKVIRWASEEITIPYISPIDRKKHRYYVDFLLEMNTANGLKTWLVEIKPKKQCRQPEKRSKTTKTYINEMKTWLVNSEKWKCASKVAENRGWEFKILTEDDLFGKKS